jgi:SAM-dependent methyltransferase
MPDQGAGAGHGPAAGRDGGDPAGTGSAVYALGSSPAERDRLRRQSEELRDHSAALLDRLGIEPGWHAIDLGCGPSGVIELLAERVGPGGRVTGLDIDPANVALARKFAEQHGLANAGIAEGDARHTGLRSASFDVAHARTLLINIPDPETVVAEMARLVRPGGWLAVLEPDVGGSFCYPPHRAWDRLRDIFVEANRSDGADPFIGRRLPELLRHAGLVQIGVAAEADVYPVGHSRRTVRPDLVRTMRPKILERGIATERELDELDQAVRAHLADPDTLVMPHVLFLAWGRKPQV